MTRAAQQTPAWQRNPDDLAWTALGSVTHRDVGPEWAKPSIPGLHIRARCWALALAFSCALWAVLIWLVLG